MLTILDQFNSGISTVVGVGFNGASDEVLVYGAFDAEVFRFTTDGMATGSFDQAGEAANDFDLDYADTSFSLGGVEVPVGSAILINGESGVAELYAVNPVTGAVLASLTTQFGASHIVGGSYSAARNSFFMVQDKVASDDNGTVVEISLTDGSVLNSFPTSGEGYTINYGDMDIDPVTGDLFFVSSDEGSILRMSPEGDIIEELALPAGVGSLSGIAFNPGAAGEAYVVSTSGTVFRLGGLVQLNDQVGDGAADTLDGAGGADRLFGLGGDDELMGRGSLDTLSGGNGNDWLEGGFGADVLAGGAGADTLVGAEGSDTLGGGEGKDTLNGGDDNDTLIGGGARDRLNGGAGADDYRYLSVADSGLGKRSDVIEGFSQADGDRLDLRALVEGEFVYIGSEGFSGAGGAEARLAGTPTGQKVQLDVDGDGVADMLITLIGGGATGADAFVL